MYFFEEFTVRRTFSYKSTFFLLALALGRLASYLIASAPTSSCLVLRQEPPAALTPRAEEKERGKYDRCPKITVFFCRKIIAGPHTSGPCRTFCTSPTDTPGLL